MPVQAIPLPTAGVRYIDVGDADDLAAALRDLPAYRAASDEAKAAALDLATRDIDAAMPYQGRRLDPAQPLAFPRLSDEPTDRAATAGFGVAGSFDPALVWDWDATAGAAVVPADVRLATLYQADSILAGTREARLSAQHDGVAYELTGGLAESYKASGPAPGVPTGLCRRAWVLMRRYHLRSGRLT
jgi:hypothetical protein